ncbi:Pleckstrin domain-containing family G member 1, partial [Stegodyphus mimosarum]
MALQHSLPLGSYLLKPVQRILKYHLLLQNMVKHSDKESDGYCDVKNALSVMTGIAYHINDMKRKHEHAVRVQEIQSLLYGWEGQDLTTYGELVAEGAFRMYRAKALRHLFLFDKMLLIAKKKEEGILSYKTHIMCSNLMLIESIQGEPLCFHVIPFDNPRYQYTFQARNVEQKREWCLQLKRVILENYNAVIPSHARQLVMELGQSKQEDSALEKSTTKRQLSAPEYLEKRKQERRKSELNL